MRAIEAGWRPRKPWVLSLVFMGAVLALCYAPVVFGGKSLQSPLYTVSAVLPGGPWEYAGRKPANTFDVDMATPAFYEWPLDRYVGKLLRSGELPLWNPHQGAGLPVVGNYSTRVFFPFQMLLNVCPPGLWDHLFLVRLLIAGGFTYLFLTRAGLGWIAATFGGIAYMLSGTFVWFINLEQYVNTAMVVPAWFLAIECFVQRPNARRIAWVALAVGLILLAGQPEIALYSLVAGGLFGIVRWVSAASPPATLRRAGTFAVLAVVLGFAIAAVQLLPFVDHLQTAVHLHHSGGDMGVRDPAPGSLAIQLFVPSFYELPTALRTMPDNGRWDFLGGYAGVLALFLTVAGLVLPPWTVRPTERGTLIFFGAVAAWILLKNFGIPPFDWIGYLPFFDQVWTPRWAGPTWCFAAAAGAAFGLERLKNTAMTPAIKERLGISAAGVLLVVGIFAGIGFAALVPAQDMYWPFILPGAIGGAILALSVVSLAAVTLARCKGSMLGVVLLALLLIERWYPIPRGYPPLFLALRLAPIGLGLMAVTLVIFGRRAAAGGAALLAIVLALAIDPFSPLGLPTRADPAAAPPVVQFLRERTGLARIMGDSRVLAPNYASVFGLYDVRYIDALSVEWFHDYVASGLETQPRRWWHALWFVGSPDRQAATQPRRVTSDSPLEQDLRARLRGYSLLGVRYIVTPLGMDLNRSAETPGARFPVVYDNEVLVYENPGAFPRAFTVSRWEFAADPAAARERTFSPEFDPRTSAVIEDASAGSGGDGTVRIAAYGPTRLRVAVEMAHSGLVVLTDTYYPGWEASIDGRPTRIYRVDGVFRGVFVDQGQHDIVMRFRPRSQFWGFVLSGLALTVVIGLTVTHRHRA
jgi:hypothetical protein